MPKLLKFILVTTPHNAHFILLFWKFCHFDQFRFWGVFRYIWRFYEYFGHFESFMSILVILEVFLVILDGPEVFWTFYEYFVHFGGQSILVIL